VGRLVRWGTRNVNETEFWKLDGTKRPPRPELAPRLPDYSVTGELSRINNIAMHYRVGPDGWGPYENILQGQNFCNSSPDEI
jgi:hypothetical protein